MGGKGEMIKAPISLQDLRRRIYVKAKAEIGWKRWSKRWLYEVLGLYGNYRVRGYKPRLKAFPVR
jgi:RNA-directed DNA polymerase